MNDTPGNPAITSTSSGSAPDHVTGRPMAKPMVDIVIVNWNSGDYLRQCLQSIADHGNGYVKSVIVVDNGSSDQSEQVEVPGISLKLIKAGANLGFGRACNKGAKIADAPYILFFNPDAALMPESLAPAIRFMEGEGGQSVGALGIKLIDEDGRVQHHTTDRLKWWTVFAHSQRATVFDHLTSRPVDHVIGAFYLVRTKVFTQLNGFDERFFVYLEDVDLSARIQDTNWEVYYLAEAQAFHKGGGTSEQVKARRLYYSIESRIRFSFKHFSPVAAVAVTSFTLIVEPFLRIARVIVKSRFAESLEVAHAYALVYRSLLKGDILRKAGAR
ncbi:MAG: glycosyltransferase family 2 protein [Sphingomonas bacterium]|nr:glycosyltransferase family 2 protein [Sphingomonas bacterium]